MGWHNCAGYSLAALLTLDMYTQALHARARCLVALEIGAGSK